MSTQILNQDQLTTKGALLLPSRLDAGDLQRIIKLCGGRSLALLTEGESGITPALQSAIRSSGLSQFPRMDEHSRETVAAAVEKGTLVLCIPPAVQSRRATNVLIPRDYLTDIAGYQLPTQCIGVEHPQENALDVEDRSSLPACVFQLSPLLPGADATPAALQQALISAHAEAYASRATFEGNLGRMMVAGLKQHSSATIVDGLDGSVTPYSRIFAAAAALAGFIKKETKEPRVGIVLPPGRAALIANLAVVFAGKVPVNLNYTAGKEAVESAIRQSGVDRYITADVIVRKMQTFPWPALKHMILIERELPRMKSRAARWLIAQKLLPAGLLSSLLGLPRQGGDAEAALLFTSGSSGEPKGVVLSHRNLIANVSQFSARLDLPPNTSILGSLPLFHSFGCTVTLWYPALQGLSLVTYPSPLEPPKLAELIEKHDVDILLATPTFLRGYLRRVKVEQLATLKLILTGAEKLPLNLEEEFRAKFGKPVMEGYGLTETSPVTNVNLPDSPPQGDLPLLHSRRLGSVGQLLPGISLRITDPATDEPLPIDQSGMIWLRGPNIFQGYFKQPRRTEEVLKDGWFRTGDIGRLDGDGFLYIEGRLSRFSKIGGEMVPHETVEEHILRALNLDDAERRVAVVGVPDPDKGEALVLLSTVAGQAVKQELIQLRYTLLDRGVPALWIPRRMVPVEHIPILASGKLDIKGCERLAAAAGE